MEKDRQFDQTSQQGSEEQNQTEQPAEVQEGLGSDTIWFQTQEENGAPTEKDDIAEIRELLKSDTAESSEPPTSTDRKSPQKQRQDPPPAEDFSLDEDGPTVVKAPKRKKRSPWSVAWAVSTFFWRLALGVVLTIGILAIGLIGYLTVTEYNPAYAETADRGSVNRSESITTQSLSILTFNTGYGGSGADADFFIYGGEGVMPEDPEQVESNLEGIEGILSVTDADFIFLQEVDVGSRRSHDTRQWLKYEYGLEDYESRFALNFSCEYIPYPMKTPLGKVQSGLATYSNYDIVSATRYSLPNSNSWPSRIANPKRCILVTRIPIEDSEQQLVLINVHLDANDDSGVNEDQMDLLIALVREEYGKGNFVIAGGDFNSTFPNSDAYEVKDPELWAPKKLQRLPAGLRYVYDDSEPTCRLLNQPYDPKSEETQYYVIDGFLVSSNVTVDQVETLDYEFVYSDHNPVLLNFTLNFDEE